MNKRSSRLISDFNISCFGKDREESTLKIPFSFDSFDTKSLTKSLMFNHFMTWNERTHTIGKDRNISKHF